MQDKTSGCTFYIVRHGQTDWNAKGKLQGHTDIPLNDVGKNEAKSLQEEFYDFTFDAAYSSDLLRAYETATIICHKKGLDVASCDWLRERYYGPLEGSTYEERKALYDNDANQAKPSSLIEYLVSRFYPEMETAEQAYIRVMNNLKRLALKYDNKEVLIVTHAGILRYLLNPELPSNDETWKIQNCAYVKLHIQESACTICSMKGIAPHPKKMESIASIP